MLAFALTWKPRLRGMSARRRSMTFSCLSAATSAGMVPRIAVRTACCYFTPRTRSKVAKLYRRPRAL